MKIAGVLVREGSQKVGCIGVLVGEEFMFILFIPRFSRKKGVILITYILCLTGDMAGRNLNFTF